MPVPDFEWDMGGKTTEKYFADQFDMMINSTIEDMAGNPDRLLRISAQAATGFFRLSLAGSENCLHVRNR